MHETYRSLTEAVSQIPVDERTIAYLFGRRACAEAIKGGAEHIDALVRKACELLGRPHGTMEIHMLVYW